MKRMLQTASRGAIIALIAATPVAAYAQSEADQTEEKVIEQSESGTASGSVEADTSADVAADEPAATDESTDVAEDEAAPETDADVASDAPVATDDSTDMAQDDGMTDPAADDSTMSTDMATDDTGLSADGEQMAAEEPAKPVEGQITMQDADTVLAEDLLGATVYNGSNENVGDINDLIIGLNGDVKGVVIGVGGFLGLGEKDVAIEMAALDVVEMDGATRLVTSASKTDLEAAPKFVTAADQASEAQQLEMESSTDSMGGTMGGTAQPTE